MSKLLFLFLPWVLLCEDCVKACDEVSITFDYDICVSNCNNKYIIIYTIISLIGLLGVILLYCYCKHCRPCLSSRETLLQKLRCEHDQPASTLHRSYHNYRDLFFRSLTLSTTNNNFYLFNQKIKVYIKADSIDHKIDTELLQTISFKGTCNEEHYTAEGSLMNCEQGLKIWFLLSYDYPERMRQLGEPINILFMGKYEGKSTYHGVWETYDEEKVQKGNWTLISVQDKQGMIFEETIECF